MARTIHLSATCLCGAVCQSITSDSVDYAEAHNFRATENLSQDALFCHCNTCRKSSGLMFTSYVACGAPLLGSLDFLEACEAGKGDMRYFCKKCGCHVFRSLSRAGEEDMRWFVATGTIDPVKGLKLVHFVGHENLSETADGGGAVWLKEVEGGEMQMFEGAGPDYYSGTTHQVVLKASCHCGTVKFHITRPDASSRLPTIPFPDLMIAYHTQDPKLKNLDDEKWWIKGDRYLAGTCACRSCRLASGFEIQEWTFVPKSNIFFNTQAGKNLPLDFADKGIKSVLKSYESSEGVVREFCAKCGATVFWRGKWRSELIDVSVGLLEAEEGARAEKWLDWWTERVSFEEDAVAHGRSLVDGLQKGIAAWGGKREAA
ncbi:hypothetical protein DL98DRAFT_470305 [Cadophora sp. DSE1049]|nr:hypothetical protein DL98DRAFT_470305 [Cadophora sp. DSE1049]